MSSMHDGNETKIRKPSAQSLNFIEHHFTLYGFITYSCSCRFQQEATTDNTYLKAHRLVSNSRTIYPFSPNFTPYLSKMCELIQRLSVAWKQTVIIASIISYGLNPARKTNHGVDIQDLLMTIFLV